MQDTSRIRLLSIRGRDHRDTARRGYTFNRFWRWCPTGAGAAGTACRAAGSTAGATATSAEDCHQCGDTYRRAYCRSLCHAKTSIVGALVKSGISFLRACSATRCTVAMDGDSAVAASSADKVCGNFQHCETAHRSQCTRSVFAARSVEARRYGAKRGSQAMRASVLIAATLNSVDAHHIRNAATVRRITWANAQRLPSCAWRSRRSLHVRALCSFERRN